MLFNFNATYLSYDLIKFHELFCLFNKSFCKLIFFVLILSLIIVVRNYLEKNSSCRILNLNTNFFELIQSFHFLFFFGYRRELSKHIELAVFKNSVIKIRNAYVLKKYEKTKVIKIAIMRIRKCYNINMFLKYFSKNVLIIFFIWINLHSLLCNLL